MVPRREVRSGVVLVRGGGGEVANRVVPGVVVVVPVSKDPGAPFPIAEYE